MLAAQTGHTAVCAKLLKVGADLGLADVVSMFYLFKSSRALL